MSAINFFRGPTANISGIPVSDGQIIFDTEKRTISMDYLNSRLPMGNTVSYHYAVITTDNWVENTAVVELSGADEYNICLGLPNPTTIENINIARASALSISAINADGITVTAENVPSDTVTLAFQLTLICS